MDRRGFFDLPGKGASLGLLLKLSPLEMLEFVQAHSSASTFRRALLVGKGKGVVAYTSIYPQPGGHGLLQARGGAGAADGLLRPPLRL